MGRLSSVHLSILNQYENSCTRIRYWAIQCEGIPYAAHHVPCNMIPACLGGGHVLSIAIWYRIVITDEHDRKVNDARRYFHYDDKSFG